MTRPCRLSVLIPVKNEARNLGKCLQTVIDWADEVVVVDSHSTDGTDSIARRVGATVVQFNYQGGWPKKRNWALDNYPWRNDWVLLLDADEELPVALKKEIASIVTADGPIDGYWIRLYPHFLGRQLHYGDTGLWKLSLFRIAKGRYERRLSDDQSGFDMEVHEHVVVDGRTAHARSALIHNNINSYSDLLAKHNKYSTWEADVYLAPETVGLRATPFGGQAQRRRWVKRFLLWLPGSPLLLFFYTYVFRCGLLDGRAGLIFAVFRMMHWFNIRTKIYERQLAEWKAPDEREGGAALQAEQTHS